MKLRMRVRLSKDRTNRPRGKVLLRRRRFCGIRFHGVISIGATMPIQLVETTRRLRHLQIPTTPATVPTVTGGGIGVFGRGGPNGGQGVFGQTASEPVASTGKA